MAFTAILLLSTTIAGSPAAAAQAAQPASKSAVQPRTTSKADAYYLFLDARQHESDGDVEGAIKLFKDAVAADPSSGDILAALANLYARQNRLREAVATAEAALKIDPDTTEAHWLLGNIYAAYAQSEEAGTTPVNRQSERDYLSKAIPHLEAVVDARGNTVNPAVLLTLGRLYLHAAVYDKAITTLLKFNEQEPGTLEGSALLADAYARAGKSPEAIKVLTEEAEREPEVYPSLAELYERTGHWTQAADTYAKAVAQGVSGPEVKRRFAAALLNTGRPGDAAKARDLLQPMVAGDPKDARALYLLAEAQRDLTDYQAAEATARQLIALEPTSLSGPYALAQVYEQQRNYRKVIDTLQPVVDREAPAGQSTPPGATLLPLLLHLGFAYIDSGQPERAIATLERAKQGAADDPTIDVGLVQAQIGARRYAQAADLARKALEEHPDDLRLARLQAEALRLNGEVDRAVSVLEQARDAHAGDPAAHVALAELLMTSHREAQAITVLQQAQAKFPQDLSVLFDLGAVYERQKQYADAEKAFKQVLALDPLHAPSLNYLGYMLADRGVRLQESVEYIQRALKVEPNNPAYLDSLGWAYFKMNRLDLAESNLRRAATDRPNDSAVQDHWGDVQLKLGHRDEAIAAWKRALAGDGEDIDRAAIEAKIRTATEKVRK